MYLCDATWLERGPSRYRAGLGDVYPGSTCYDPAHDAGMIHCSDLSSVFLRTVNPFQWAQPGITTICSDQETSCISAPGAAAAGATSPGAPTDPLTLLGTYVPWIIVGTVAIFVLPKLLGKT